MPPATTISTSPARISWSAIAIALSPDRQTLLIVIDGTLIGMPAGDRAPAGRVLAGAGQDDLAHDHVVDLVRRDTPAFSRAPLMATPPRSAALRVLEPAEQAADRGAGPGDDDGRDVLTWDSSRLGA